MRPYFLYQYGWGCFLVQCSRWPVGDPVLINRTQILIAWEQALWGALVVGWEKERELATTSLEKKSMRNEMLIGRDNISNDVITLGMCFSMFVCYFR